MSAAEVGAGGEGGGEENVDGETSVRVYVRIRPLNKKELAEKQTIGWNYNKTSMLEDTQNGQRVYAYDQCFGTNSTNAETYELVGKPVVIKAMDGYNGTVFTYGQTGSGKTWTMRGCDSDPGMMVLCIRDIFEYVQSHPEKKYVLRVSYLEVYNEEINDLLNSGPDSRNLKIAAEDAARGAVIGNLVEEEVRSSEEFMEVLYKGEANRSYASTSMNDNSSRSHVIYRVAIEIFDLEAPDDDGLDENGFPKKDAGPTSRISYMNLVDLAGSERQTSTNATGKTLKEGANINKSLLALGAVINKLGEAGKKVKGAKPVFIPYRDSKLTRILKQSLGGNTLTSILCAVSPAPMFREETVSTLKFGQLCKLIKNSVQSNVVADEKAQMKVLKQTIVDLKAQLEELLNGGGDEDVGVEEGEVGTDGQGAQSDSTSGVTALISGGATGGGGTGTGGGTKKAAGRLNQVVREKKELENKVRALEALVISSGGDLSSIPKTILNGGGGGGGGYEDGAKIGELQQTVKKLQSELAEHADLEESKQALEEYERNSRTEVEEEMAKLDKERQTLQGERYKMLAERTALDDKEGRVGQLLAALDERDSKLRQILGTLREQQEQWQRAVSDLQRREDLVDEWQRNHRLKEAKLEEVEGQFQLKVQELLAREVAMGEYEARSRAQQRELQEREQRLQVALSRAANSEQVTAAFEEKLQQTERDLRKKQGELDVRDRELNSRRREMESWDLLLREKDRKVSVEQKAIDEKELALRLAEDKSKHREIEVERRYFEMKSGEAAVKERVDALNTKESELVRREIATADQLKKLTNLEQELGFKEQELTALETHLTRQQQKLQVVDAKEKELGDRIDAHSKKEDDFFNTRVAQISAKHTKEKVELEALIAQQHEIASHLQVELEKTQTELDDLKTQRADERQVMSKLEKQIEYLKNDLQLRLNDTHTHTQAQNNTHSIGLTSRNKSAKLKPREGESGREAGSSEEEEAEGRKHRSNRGVAEEKTTSEENEDKESYGDELDEDEEIALMDEDDDGASANRRAHLRHHQQNQHYGSSSSNPLLQKLATSHDVMRIILEKNNSSPTKGDAVLRKSPSHTLRHMQALYKPNTTSSSSSTSSSRRREDTTSPIAQEQPPFLDVQAELSAIAEEEKNLHPPSPPPSTPLEDERLLTSQSKQRKKDKSSCASSSGGGERKSRANVKVALITASDPFSTPSGLRTGGAKGWGEEAVQTSAGEVGAVSPSRCTFSIHAEEMQPFIAKGERGGIPSVSLTMGFGVEQKRLVSAAKRQQQKTP